MKKILTPNNLFLLAIFCMPLYLIRLNFFGLPTNLFELIAAVAIGALFFEKNRFKEKLLPFPKSFLLALILLLAGTSLSMILNDNKLTGLGILKSWFLLPMIFSFLLYTILHSRQDIEKIFLSIYLSAATVGTISLAYKACGLMTYDDRLAAFYLSPNHLAMYLSAGIFFGSYFIQKCLRKRPPLKTFLLHLSLFFILLLSVYYTYSYGAWLAVGVSLFSMLLLTIKKQKWLITGYFFLFFILNLIFIFQLRTAKFSALVNFSERSSLESRMTIWKVSRVLITENPIMGIGPGNFQSAYLSLQPRFAPYLEWAVPQPHNVFLAFWLQSGLLGLLGFLMLLCLIFKLLFTVIKNKKDAAFAAPLFGFFLYFAVHGLLDTTYWKNDLSFLFWLCTFSTLFLYSLKDSD